MAEQSEELEGGGWAEKKDEEGRGEERQKSESERKREHT